MRSVPSWRRSVVLLVALAASILAPGGVARAQTPRKIGELELKLLGLSGTIEPLQPTVPKNTIAGVTVHIRAGGSDLPVAEVIRLLGGPCAIEAELTGPGLATPQSLHEAIDATSRDPLLLHLPAVPKAGDYSLSQIRLARNGAPLLDLVPNETVVHVIEQLLVTSVKTRPLTLDEIKAKGIVLDRGDYLGFEFTMGLELESKVVHVSMPVVFDRQGVAIPDQLPRPDVSIEGVSVPVPTVVPVMLSLQGVDAPGPAAKVDLPDGRQVELKIPSLLVIPGNVGYMNQVFSAQLFVANGAPAGSGLSVRDVTGTIELPAGDDRVTDTADDPLTLATTVSGPIPPTLPVRQPGPDGAPEAGGARLEPGEQGQAEFLIVGRREGYHAIAFDIRAMLDGLATGPAAVSGRATGGVLVRNPDFDISFGVPAIARAGEAFTLYATVTNIGKGIANDLSITLDRARMSGVTLDGDAVQRVDTLVPGDSRTLAFRFTSQRTGQVVASYLKFEGSTASGDLRFTLGVGERNVPLSPDTLVLPAVVDHLPTAVVDAAMRLLGQAWSIAQAPSGTLMAGVTRIQPSVVVQKAQLLAEAGLRVDLGEAVTDAVRDLAFDFHGGTLDVGFDQLLRTTSAGRELAWALGEALGGSADPLALHAALSEVAASGPDVVAIAVTGAPAGQVALVLKNAGGQQTPAAAPGVAATGDVRSAVFLPLGAAGEGAWLGLLTAPTAGPYSLELTAQGGGAAPRIAVTLPRGDGSFARLLTPVIALPPGGRARVSIQPGVAEGVVDVDADGDGVFEGQLPVTVEGVASQGPRLVSATVVGPDRLSSASPFGFSAALLFDRVVDRAAAADAGRYVIPSNRVQKADRQLSGRMVFLVLDQPEGPYVPSTLRLAAALPDLRGHAGAAGEVALASRLADTGAIVTGRVIQADGQPVALARVVYSNNASWRTCEWMPPSGMAAALTDQDGRFEFRYVRRDNCGHGFAVTTQDPVTGAAREVRGYVVAPGERLAFDLVLAGRGVVSGVVRSLAGVPVPDATVGVASVADVQSGGVARTDGDGRYTVYGVTVGSVTVKAVKGASLGLAAGQIQRAGTTAVVDVILDTGSASVAGTVHRLDAGGAVTPLAGALVVYEAPRTVGSTDLVPVAYTRSDGSGHFLFENSPAGRFRLTAHAIAYDRASFQGTTAPGDTLTGADIVIAAGTGVVSGSVLLPNGDPAASAEVSVLGRAALTDAGGRFSIGGLPLDSPSQAVRARSSDGIRSGAATVTLDRDHPAATTTVVLSGLGTARFKLVDATGAPVAGHTVILVAACSDPCGCSAATQVTDAAGLVSFTGVPVGTARAVAYRVQDDTVDAARASAAVPADGALGDGTLRFAGTGSLDGVVIGPDGRPALGADIEVSSNAYEASSCSLVPKVSQRLRTDQLGRFLVPHVNLGPVTVTASSAFAPTRVSQRQTLTVPGDALHFSLRLADTIAGSLTGTVYLPDGKTVAGAGVEVRAAGPLPDTVVRTDEQGRFSFARVLPAGSYSLTLFDATTGFVAQERIFLQAGQDLAHDVRLKGRGPARVRVADANGHAVTEAFVRLREAEFPGNRYEGAAQPANLGVVEFAGVSEGPVSVEAFDSHGRGGRASGYVTATGAGVDIEVRLSVTGTVRGRFYLPGGVTPVPFGTVKLLASNRVIGEQTTAGVEDVGSFSFEWVPAGDLRLEAQDPATGRSGVAAGTLTTEGQAVVLDVVARGVGSVQGLVTGNGAPQPGAWVTVTSGAFRARSLADGTGHYLVGGVPEGRIGVQASLDSGLLAGTASGTLTGDAATLTLDVALRGSGRLSGTVRAFDGSVAPLATVTARVGGLGGGTFTTLTGDQGGFAFDRLPAGLTSVTADAVGSADYGSASVEILAGEGAVADITLTGLGSLHGVALDSAGTPVIGSVTVKGTGITPYQFTLNTQPDGTFDLRDILSGPYTVSLTARPQGVTLRGSTAGALAPGTTGQVEVRLQDTGTVTGIVVEADGATPADGARVVLDLGSAYGQLSTVVPSGADGRFELAGVPMGTFRLSVSDPRTTGVGRALGIAVSANGDLVDVGTIVLDDSPVVVVGVDPPDGATGVLPTRQVKVVFSDPVSSTAGVELRNPAGASVTGWSLSGDGLTVTSTSTLPQSTDLILKVTTALSDVYGRHPVASLVTHFRTADLTPPSVAAISPSNLQYQVAAAAPVVVTFTEALSDSTPLPSLVTVSGPGGPVPGTVATTGPAVATFTPSAPLADNATYQVTVNGAIDASGNQQTAAFTSRFSTTDTVPPVLAAVSPAPSAWVNTSKPPLDFTVADALIGVDPARIVLTVDGVTAAPAFSGGHVRLTLASPLADGAHALQLTAADKAGNTGQLAVPFGVDTTPPAAADLTSPSPGQAVAGSVVLAVAARDAGSGVARVEYVIDGGTTVTAAAPPFSATVDTTTMTEGRHSVVATAYDQAGNAGPAGAVTGFIVDNRPLAVTVTSPAPGTRFRGQVRVTATASEAVDHLEFAIGDALVVDDTAPFDAVLDLSSIPNGDQQVTVTAVGIAGERVSTAVTIVVDQSPTTLQFEGALADKVGPGAAALLPDGDPDAVFTVGVDLGEGATRDLVFVDLAGPLLRSTRAAALSALGVAPDQASPLLNSPDGEVAFSLTGRATLTLYASNLGFVAPGQTYTVTLGFADGGRLTGRYVIGASGSSQTVDGGHSHSIVVTPDRRVATWGNNAYGQLGDGTTTNRSVPVDVAGLADIVAVAGGHGHTLALKADGTVWAFGENADGQLGDGTLTQRATPVQVLGLGRIVSIAAGWYHSFAMEADGTVWVWGRNTAGQFCDGSTVSSQTPVVSAPLASSVLVRGGSDFTLALRSDGTVLACGLNNHGQLGDGTTANRPAGVVMPGIASAVRVEAGEYHALVQLADGTVRAVGGNDRGQLGDGSFTERRSPVAVRNLPVITEVQAGAWFSLARTSSGGVYVWGYNYDGQVGDGTTTNRNLPVRTSTLPAVASATAGGFHEIAITADGVVSAWGWNARGQIGDGTTASRTRPVTISAPGYAWLATAPVFSPPPGTFATAPTIAMSTSRAGAVIRYTTDGSTPTESSAAYTGPFGLGQSTTLKAAAFRAGWLPSAVTTATYYLSLGQLAAPAVSPASGSFVSGVTLTMSAEQGAAIRYTLDGSDPTESSFAYTGPVLLQKSATVKARAFRTSYLTSPATTGSYSIVVADPVLDLAPGTYPAGRAVAVTEATPDAVLHYTTGGADPTEADVVLAPGSSVTLGNFTLKVRAFKAGCTASAVVGAAYAVTGAVSAPMVVAGSYHTSLALSPDGTVWAWGRNDVSQVGDGTHDQRSTPARVAGMAGIAAITSGETNGFALATDGRVWGWGGNSGWLGDGTTAERARPVLLAALPEVVALSARRMHALAIGADASVWAWGFNGNGELGDGTLVDRTLPIQVPGLAGVTAVAAGASTSLALTGDGRVWGWGYNASGQVGDGTRATRTRPTVVPGLTNVTRIASGYGHSLALRSDGTVWAWGAGSGIGDGAWTDRLTPVQVPGLAGVVGIAAGSGCSFAVTSDGAVWAWGSNSDGKLGDGTATQRPTPVPITALSGVVAVGAGARHTVALTADGTVWSWGNNLNGELGDGTTVARSVPVPISDPGLAWRAATPTLSVASGTYATARSVTIACSDPAAVIHYTVDGSTPTAASPVYTGPLSIATATTLQARAYRAGYAPSTIAAASYNFDYGVLATPVATPAAGEYVGALQVTLSGPAGAVIRYTLDGSEPTPASAAYTVPFTIAGSTVLRARAFQADWTPSETLTVEYTITGTPIL